MLPIKINLGSGPSMVPGWINYDWGALPLLSKFPLLRKFGVKTGILSPIYDVPWPKIKLVDIRKRFPLPSDHVDFIYCSHVLEHFERWEAIHILTECHRVLKQGGRVRIVVPDVRKLCEHYLRSMNTPQTSRPGQELCRLWWGHPKDIKPKSLVSKILLRFVRGHQWMYDADELALSLKEAGFTNINQGQFREGLFPDLNLLDLETYSSYSLYTEAVK